MESLIMLCCLNCNEKFTEVYMFPCLHNFCSKCTNLMKNEAETSCLICSNSCHQDEVKRNAFLEKICLIESQNKTSEIELIVCELCETDSTENQADKYCVDCSQYICLKCSARHVKSKISKDHNIVDKNNLKNLVIKSPEPYCEKHETKFTIYCKTCDSIMCATCCHMDLLHSDHDKSDNLKDVFSQSFTDLKNRIVEMDEMIKDQNKLIEENQVLHSNLFKNCDDVRNKIEGYAKELKDKIDDITKANIDRLISTRNNIIKSVQAKLNEISNYISSLTNLKSYFQEVINRGSNVDVFNSKKEFNQNTWIETKKPKFTIKFHLSFQKPFNETLILTELPMSLISYEINDLKIMLKNSIISACVFKHNIYTTKSNNKSIDIYDIETGQYQTSIDYKQCFKKDINGSIYILSTENDLFLYYNFSSSKYTCILKFKGDDKTFFELKTLEYNCTITSTFQQTFLVISTTNILIELSANGDELKRIILPEAAIVNCYTITAHILDDGRYVMTSPELLSCVISLLDAQGILIKSFTKHFCCSNRTCTDGKKYIFYLDKHFNMDIITITVLSTDLQQLHQFDCPGVKNIFYDRVNDKLLLVKDNEIIYITYHLGMLVSI